MPYQVKYVLRHRDGVVRTGAASHYRKQSGWRDFAGVPASYKYGIQMGYNPALAERCALSNIADKVIVGEDDNEWARKHNADLYWSELEQQYDALGVHRIYRNKRPVEKQAA